MLRSADKAIQLAGGTFRGELANAFRGPLRDRATNVGASTGTSAGVTVTTGGAHTKGNWAEVEDSLAADCDGFFVSCNNGGGAARFIFDVGIGAAAAEVVLVPDVLIIFNSQAQYGYPIFCPIGIKAGTRIAVRAQAHVATQTMGVTIQPVAGEMFAPMRKRRATSYGLVLASTTSNCSPDPDNTAHTKGAYDELVASTTNPIELLSVFLVPTAANPANQHLIDVAVGAAGSEVVVLPDLWFHGNATTDAYVPPLWGPFPVRIPAGSRIAVREQVSGSGGTPTAYISVLGFD